MDRGPNTPASEPAAAPRTRVSARSRFSVLTISSGSCSVGAFILVASRSNSAETEREHQWTGMVLTGSMPALQRAGKDARVESIVKRAKTPRGNGTKKYPGRLPGRLGAFRGKTRAR